MLYNRAVGLFEYIDLFGLKFSFYTFSKRRYHTLVGIILSFLVIALLIFFTIYLGWDFFLQINPKITQTSLHPASDNRFVHLDPSNFTMSWRIEDPGGNPFNYTDILYPQFSHESFFINDTTAGQRAKVQKVTQFIDTQKCDSEFVKDEFFLNFKNTTLDEWNCINLQKYNLTLGGLFLTTDLFNLVLRIYFCPQGDFFSPKCAPYTKLKKLMYEQNLYISFNFPVYFIDKQNKTKPLQYQYQNTRVLLDLFLNRQDRLYFEEISLNNDKGIIFDEQNLESILTKTKYESYFTSVLEQTWQGYDKDKQYGEDNLWDFIYLLRIYFDKDYTVAELRYIKLQDLAAIIGGLMQILFVAGKVLSHFFNHYYQNISFINEYFEFSSSDYNKYKQAKTNMNNNIEAKMTGYDDGGGLIDVQTIKEMETVNLPQMRQAINIDLTNNNSKKITRGSVRYIDKNNMIETPIDDHLSKKGLNEPNSDSLNKPSIKNNRRFSPFKPVIANARDKELKVHLNINEKLNINTSLLQNDVDRLLRNVYTTIDPDKDYYDLKKPKGELVITDHSLNQRNKVFSKNLEELDKNGKVDHIFQSYKEQYDKEQEKRTSREFKFSLGKYCGYMLKNMCCKSQITDKDKHSLKIYDYASNFVHSTLDIANYIKLQSTINSLKILTLPGNHQSLAFDMFKKPNLHNAEELVTLDMDMVAKDEAEIKENKINRRIAVMKYFAENFIQNNDIEKNALVFDMLDPKFKLYIIDAAKELEKENKDENDEKLIEVSNK